MSSEDDDAVREVSDAGVEDSSPESRESEIDQSNKDLDDSEAETSTDIDGGGSVASEEVQDSQEKDG